MKVFSFIVSALTGMCALASAVAEPSVELSATSTNLVVTESTSFAVCLWLPPLEGELRDVPPYLNQRPPHVEAAFLEPKWSPGTITAVDPRHVPPVELRSRDGNAPVYTLNNYVSDDFFGGGRDPFSLFDDDDFFGRTLGPRPQRFPFKTRRAERGGVLGWEFRLETDSYQATTPGKVELAPVSVKVPVITGVRMRTQRDRFGRARQVNVPTVKEVVLRTGPLVVTVSEPPAEGCPKSFCGAISSNLTVAASLDTNICTAGDPLILTLDVAGASNPASVHVPSFAAELDRAGVFRVDEASLKTETLADSRRFSWRVKTLKPGTVEFPALTVGYYDLPHRSYVEVRTESIPVQVKAGRQVVLGALDETGEEVEKFPQPDGVDLDPRGAVTEPLVPHLTISLALLLGAPLFFLVIRLFPPIRRRIAVRNAAYRRSTAFAKCRRALKGRDDERRLAAVRRFFEVRYGVNGASMTAADARRLMAEDFSAEEIDLVANALSDFDRTNYSAKRTIVSLLIASLAVFGTFAASPEFTYRRASSLATRAVSESDFRKAAQAYADCVDQGIVNPILLSNLGACAVMGGEMKRALAAYGRVELRTGETATTRRGIRAALSRLKNDAREDLPLTRFFFRPHFLYSLDARLLFAATIWTVCWLLALLPPGGAKRFLLTVAAFVCMAALVSVAVSLVEEHFAEGVVYVAK